MNTKSDIVTILAMAAGIVGAVAYCVGFHYGWGGVLVCGLLLFFSRLRERMAVNDFAQRRILSILMFSAVALSVCAYLMMKDKSYWPVPLLISACLELYSSFRLK